MCKNNCKKRQSMRRQFTMPKKISATVLFTCLLFGLVSWLLLFAQTDQLAKQAIDDKGFSSLAQLHEAILTPLLSNDTISQQVSLQRATEDERVISASLMDIEGQLIAQSASSLLKTTKTKTFKQAIEFQNTQAGIISVEVNSQPIMAQYHRVFINWLLLWLAFTVLCTYGCYRFVDQITARIERLSERLPGKTEPLADEISALETKIQPLLSTSGDSSLAPNNKYFYSLVSGNIKNNQRLLAQLNRDNLDQLLEKLDYCILRTLQLYGGERIEGTEDSFCFAIRSTHCSKQHLLVCLMAVYSLQQLVEQLSKKSGIELEINWIISSDDIGTTPQFWYEQSIIALKKQNMALASDVQEGLIVLHCSQFSIDELSSIARFQSYDKNQFILEGFSESRLQVLRQQLGYLIGICLD